MGRREAIEQAAAIRLRPILMTTAAMVVAMVPLLFARGAGAASRFAIGVVIAAGMTIGTLFTLFVTPAVYTYIARDHQKVKERDRAAEAVADVAHEPKSETLAEEDAEADAGMLFPGEPEPIDGALSPEARAIGFAAAAAPARMPDLRSAAEQAGAAAEAARASGRIGKRRVNSPIAQFTRPAAASRKPWRKRAIVQP